MIPVRSFAFASLILLTSCSHSAPKVTVEVLDTSLSITPRAENAAETAILEQIIPPVKWRMGVRTKRKLDPLKQGIGQSNALRR